MRILIAGAGGVGGLYAALLARASADVTLVARGEHLRAIQVEGLRLQGSIDVATPLRTVRSIAEAGAADLVLLCVKAYDLESAARELLPHLQPDTAVLTLQNGVEQGERLAGIIGVGRTLVGATYIVARRIAPGVIHHYSDTRIEFGALSGGPSERLATIEAVLRAASVDAAAVPEVERSLWRKFISIVAIGGINCLTRAPAAAWRDLPDCVALVEAIAREVEALAAARGIILGDDGVPRVLRTLRGLGDDYSTSMLADLLSGARLELETLQGAVVRLGRDLGVATPHTFAAYAALRPFRDGAAASVM